MCYLADMSSNASSDGATTARRYQVSSTRLFFQAKQRDRRRQVGTEWNAGRQKDAAIIGPFTNLGNVAGADFRIRLTKEYCEAVIDRGNPQLMFDAMTGEQTRQLPFIIAQLCADSIMNNETLDALDILAFHRCNPILLVSDNDKCSVTLLTLAVEHANIDVCRVLLEHLSLKEGNPNMLLSSRPNIIMTAMKAMASLPGSPHRSEAAGGPSAGKIRVTGSPLSKGNPPADTTKALLPRPSAGKIRVTVVARGLSQELTKEAPPNYFFEVSPNVRVGKVCAKYCEVLGLVIRTAGLTFKVDGKKLDLDKKFAEQKLTRDTVIVAEHRSEAAGGGGENTAALHA